VEGRNLKMLTLRTGIRQKKLWIDAGIHAREWLAPCTCTWIVDSLIKEFNANNPDVIKLFNFYEFNILCLVNPDGYEFSRESQRLWRKNRSTNNDGTCMGVDLNRNCDAAWMHSGASQILCADTYAGPAPDSEPETRAVQSVINQGFGQLGQEYACFITIHTYGQWWLTSWGYNITLPYDYNELFTMGTIGANALKAVNGTVFTVGSSARLLYDNSGSSQDWAKSKGGIKYSYTLELRPGAGTPDALFGFVIPENRCPVSGMETYAGLKALFLSIGGL